jgi:hypothetical protein
VVDADTQLSEEPHQHAEDADEKERAADEGQGSFDKRFVARKLVV